MNLIYGQGHVTEVETKESRNGLLIGNIKLKTEDSQFFLTAFGDTAQVVAALQGSHVAFTGTLNARTYTTRDGTDTWAMSPTIRELTGIETPDETYVRGRFVGTTEAKEFTRQDTTTYTGTLVHYDITRQGKAVGEGVVISDDHHSAPEIMVDGQLFYRTFEYRGQTVRTYRVDPQISNGLTIPTIPANPVTNPLETTNEGMPF